MNHVFDIFVIPLGTFNKCEIIIIKKIIKNEINKTNWVKKKSSLLIISVSEEKTASICHIWTG